MDNDRTDYLINRILSGILIFYYQNQEYELRPASTELKYRACLLYDKTINDEKYNDWIHEKNMIRVMISLGLWDEQSNKMVVSLEKSIEDNKVKLFESIKRPDNFKTTKKNLESLKRRLNRLLNIKSNFRNNTLQGYAESVKSEFLICNNLYHNKNRLFKNNYITSHNNVSYSFFNGLVQEIYKHEITVADIREVSRSPQWRTYWAANKENVLPGPVSKWTDDQRTLINYSRMYDNVYEHPDCPEDKVIEDDDTLDGWFIFQKRKREREKNQSKFNSKTNSKLDKAQEIFLFPNENQTAEEIRELNDPVAKMKLKQKLNFINSASGTVEDSQLPDVKADIMNQRAEIQRMKKK